MWAMPENSIYQFKKGCKTKIKQNEGYELDAKIICENEYSYIIAIHIPWWLWQRKDWRPTWKVLITNLFVPTYYQFELLIWTLTHVHLSNASVTTAWISVLMA